MNTSLSRARITAIKLLILVLFPLLGMGIDLLAPSLPAISHNLQVSNTFSQSSITLFLLGLAVGNPIVGFLSDAVGRKKILLIGSFAFAVISLLPALLPSITVLLLIRFLQGLSIASFNITCRAVLTDILTQEEFTRFAPVMATMWGIGPIIGPVIGGYLQFFFNWQACFYFFAAYGLIGFMMVCVILPETHTHPIPLNFKTIKNNTVAISTHTVFLGSALLMALSFSLLIVFNTLGPFLVQVNFGHSAVYFGHVALWMGVSFLAGTLVCRQLLKKYSLAAIFPIILTFGFLVVVIGLASVYVWHENLKIFLYVSVAMFFACGILYPMSLAKGIGYFRHIVGSASAIMNLIILLITSLVTVLISLLNNISIPLIIQIYLALMILICVSYAFLLHNLRFSERYSRNK